MIPLIALILASLTAVAQAGTPSEIPTDAGRWTVNADSGAIHISPGNDGTLRLAYKSSEAPWGNAASVVFLPPNAAGIEFKAYKHKAVGDASMFLWLIEEDGDGWLSHLQFDGKRLAQAKDGRHHIYVPITKFQYDPRGNRKKEILTTKKLLIGFNGGDCEVSVSDLKFVTSNAAGSVELPKSTDIKIEEGVSGRVGILREDFARMPSDSDPETLAGVLKDGGFGVTFLSAGDLADPSILKPENFDCVIFPYGSRFPKQAREAILGYLKAGGAFFSTGGYAFDTPMAIDENGKWVTADSTVTASDITKEDEVGYSLNTRKGKQGDTMGLLPDQIGAFDPSYLLKDVSYSKAATDQHILPAVLKMDGKLEGYAACAMLGSNSPVFPEKWGRWVPLVDACDKSGRPRGAAGAIAYNYAGPFKGSNWAFFGVTNKDVFAEGSPLLKSIPDIVRSLTSGVYLHSLKTELACYGSFDEIKFSYTTVNMGSKEDTGVDTFEVVDRSGKVVISKSFDTVRKPNQQDPVTLTWSLPELTDDLYILRVKSKDAKGKVIDSIETGFVNSDAKLADGLKLNFKDNYFRDGNRPVLLSGANHTGAIFYSGNEDPLVWDRDLAKMRENGVNVLRVLHFSPFMADKPSPSAVTASDLAIDNMPVKIERQLDALVRLCGKHKVVLFLTLHDWIPVELSGNELEAQKKFARLIAARYKDMPWVMFDIQNEPILREPESPDDKMLPHVTAAWNEFLRTKYGTDEALKSAWKVSPPLKGIGQEPFCAGKDDRQDQRTLDTAIFRQSLVDKWIKANADGCREGNPNALVTVGFLQEYWALDKITSVKHLDFANMHSYNSIDILRCDLKLFDRRFEGKSISLGEFGSIEDHNKRVDGQDIVKEDYNRFLLTGHYLYGLGGSMGLNWCWKDMDDVIFPWGINHLCDGVRKDILKAYRNQTLLFRQIKPLYRSPEVFLVVPSNQMLAGERGKTTRALYNSIEALYGCRVDFGTIDDGSLDKLPKSAKVLFYPVSYSPSEKVLSKLKSFVDGGGTLYVSGASEKDIAALQADGNKRVFFSADPPEFESIPMDLYRSVLDSSGVARLPIDAASLLVHAFRLYSKDGKTAYVLVNASDSIQSVSINQSGSRTDVVLSPNGTGLALYNKTGKLTAVEAQGPVKMNGKEIIGMKGHFAVVSGDDGDIASSDSLVILPFDGGKLKINSNWRKPAVVVGDIYDGRWQQLSEIRNPKSEIECGGFDIMLAGEDSKLAELAEKVRAELMLDE